MVEPVGFPERASNVYSNEASAWQQQHTVINNKFRDEAMAAGLPLFTKAFWVYVKLRDYEEFTQIGYCFCSRSRLAEEIGYTTRQVTRAFQYLKEVGLVEHIWAFGSGIKLARGAIYVSKARLDGLKVDDMRVGKERKIPDGAVYLDLETGLRTVMPNNGRCSAHGTRCSVNGTSRGKDVPSAEHLTGTKSLNINKSLNKKINSVPKNSEHAEIVKKASPVKELIDHWNKVMGGSLCINDLNRYAIIRLEKKFGTDTLKRVISALPEMLATPYETRVSDFVDLEKRWNKVMDWGRRRAIAQAKQNAEIEAERAYKPF